MDNETSQAFVKVLEYITNQLGKTVENNGGNITEYVKKLGTEVVNYKLNIAYMWEIVACALLVVGIICLIVSFVQSSDGWFFAAVLIMGTAVVIAIYNGYTIIGCKTFPEKIILDYMDKFSSTLRQR